jgi:hypothetical protein
MKNAQKTSFKAKKLAEIAGSLLLVAFFILPFLSMAKGKTIYVNANASGSQDGSAAHPYKTIWEALRHAEENTKLLVSAGKYKANIHIPNRVSIFGESKDKVIIEASDDSYETVDMDDNSKIDKVTIKGGEYGVRVGHDEKASITNCVIKDNDKAGVLLEKSSADDDHKVSISNSTIKDNDDFGIFSAKRRLILIDNEIVDNGKDGILAGAGSRDWFEGNSVKGNGGTGLKLFLDGSYIWTKNNSFADNGREGIEVNAYGGSGTIDLKDSKIHNNDRWGIARIQRGDFNASVWNGLVIHGGVNIYDNNYGNISGIIVIK